MQMQPLKETEGMGDAPPSHWTENPNARKALRSAMQTENFSGR